jgi:hypothetical protein
MTRERRSYYFRPAKAVFYGKMKAAAINSAAKTHRPSVSIPSSSTEEIANLSNLPGADNQILSKPDQESTLSEEEQLQKLADEDELEFHRLARDLVFCLSVECQDFFRKHGCVLREHEYRMFKIGEIILQGGTPPPILLDNNGNISELYNFSRFLETSSDDTASKIKTVDVELTPPMTPKECT